MEYLLNWNDPLKEYIFGCLNCRKVFVRDSGGKIIEVCKCGENVNLYMLHKKEGL
jgi:hypothetical protein